MRDDDRLTMLLYEQLKDQLNLLAIHRPSRRRQFYVVNNELHRTWLQFRRRKVLN